MSKNFFEVFSNLTVDDNLSSILNTVTVDKISTTSDRSSMHIFLHSNNLIPKRRIWTLEDDIKSQYFSQAPFNVSIIEKFDLSSQYTPEILYNMYKDSILEEVHRYNAVIYQIIRISDFSFSEKQDEKSGVTKQYLKVTLPDTAISHQKEEEILHILDRIFCDRCGQKVIIDFDYKYFDSENLKKQADEKVERKVQAIRERLEELQQEDQEDDENKDSDKSSKPASPSKKDSSKNAASSSSNPYDHADTPAGDKENGSIKSDDSSDQPRGQRYNRFRLVRSSNPDCLYGRDFDDEAMALKEVTGEMGTICVHGQITRLETREIRNEKTIVSFDITDFTDSITCKIFLNNDQVEEFTSKVKSGIFVRIKGQTQYDQYDKEITISRIYGIMASSDFRTPRMDTAVEKRVELHCHTKMSDMDAVSDVKDIVKQAAKWGHRAIAITDHGVVQSFPDAASAAKDAGIKILYGCEVYLVDDTKTIATNERGQSLDDEYVVFDLETTGLNASAVNIIEIGAVKVKNGEITDRFSEFVNPKMPIPFRIIELTSITDDMVKDADPIEKVLPRFKEFCGDAVLVAHNADFDTSCVHAWGRKLGIDWNFSFVDTIPLARYLLPNLGKATLDNVAKELKVELGHHHRAVDDAECTALIFNKCVSMLRDRKIYDLTTLNQKSKMDEKAIRKAKSYHCIIIAKNDVGRINLYRLVSMSHLKYQQRVSKMPKSEILKHREGLIIGSACEAGELYQALETGKDDAEIERIVRFYDYLEIQPNGNNAFLLREGDNKYGINTEEDLNNINRRIVKLGEIFHKPVCATCDVHFLNPEDEIYRRIIQYEKGFSDADQQPPLYLHTTDEMLKEFSYLGEEKAEEVVIKNPNRIADMCDEIMPTRPDKCPPVIPHSAEMLRKICETRAHELYGPELPQQVNDRLERELNSIIGNGYAVMYIIAQKLVWKSNEDGYLVGSRGSVGSSFVATMAGITEVNPLPAHYLCPNCHYVDFDSDEVKAYSGRAGVDMPDKICPRCGRPLSKEGFDIPFETFLGFKGNKEPDIDLNFSGDYQSKAHAYTAVIFGDGQTFKAGTVGTIADKNAYGYIKKYFEEHDTVKRNAEINRLIQGCVGVRRTTGQHPGGIVVLPVGEEIDTFTPVQHPADKMDTDIITTHFDYHKIDGNLLKLDILGHQDPTMIRKLEDLTNIDATKIPLDDKKVMSLFMNTDALGVTPDDLWDHCQLGTLGIPEFGTNFAMNLVMDAKPKELTDLIRISGLSHGTGVWDGNAKDLILNGTADISTVIACRDDIMVYLINKGLDKEESFTIMERVRKGVVAKGKCKEWPQYVQDMKDHGVPDWYIESCKKIQYMFPKAHAAAYVIMGWRVGYFKIYYPLAYYAAYFSIRADNFSYEIMCQGQETLEHYLKEIKEKKSNNTATPKEKGLYDDMRLVQEMYARGFEFLPMDLYESDARYFKIVDGKLLPPFASIDGMGDKAAETLAIAASQQKFLSRDDLRERGKVSQTIVDTMDRLGILKDLPESNQLSFADILNYSKKKQG